MLKIYLDNCCLNRPFDDLRQTKIAMEAEAKRFIQSLVRYHALHLVYSYISLFEIEKNPHEYKKSYVLDFLVNADIYVEARHKEVIYRMAIEIMRSGIKEMDALHVACALFAKCDYFITTDERLLRYRDDRIILYNPVKFVEFWENSHDR